MKGNWIACAICETYDVSGRKFCPNCGTKVPMNAEDFPIVAPADLVRLCQEWHAGQWTALYSVASTGTIADAEILYGLESETDRFLKTMEASRVWLNWVNWIVQLRESRPMAEE